MPINAINKGGIDLNIMNKTTGKSISKNSLRLTLLCFFVYYLAYLGRYSYSSNINGVIDYFSISKANAGSIATCFFISYGIGQVVNGLLCKRYNPKIAISLALAVSALTNLFFPVLGENSFELLRFLWLINGFAQSVLWSSIIRLLNENLPKNSLKGAILIMALPVSMGTFTIYGLSSLLSALSVPFKGVFLIAGGLLLAIALIWFVNLDSLKNACRKEREADEASVAQPQSDSSKKGNLEAGLLVSFGVLALFAIINNFVKDGLTTWLPVIMKEKYLLDDAISIFLTLFLPFFAVFGSTLAIFLNQRLKNHILVCGVLYLSAFLLFIPVIIFFNQNYWLLTLVCFILVACAMSGVNNVITNIFPMLHSGKINAGTLAGVMDGFCYVGSAITAYGIGSLADNFSWETVLYLFVAVCLFTILICAVYMMVARLQNKKKAE